MHTRAWAWHAYTHAHAHAHAHAHTHALICTYTGFEIDPKNVQKPNERVREEVTRLRRTACDAATGGEGFRSESVKLAQVALAKTYGLEGNRVISSFSKSMKDWRQPFYYKSVRSYPTFFASTNMYVCF